MTKRRQVPKRIRFFAGCEGESEQGYVTHLDWLARERDLHLHIKAVNLQPAGDPCALATKAIALADKEAKRKGAFVARAIFLDTDRLDQMSGCAEDLDRMLELNGFIPIWQQRDHEAFLLRHFSGHESDNPSSGQTLSRLQSQWPGYRKGMPAADIRRILEFEHIQRAASVTPNFKTFLQELGMSE